MIRFKTIKWRNFLSTGNSPTEVFLDRSPATLIVGENGAGKSTILDALCYALFNKPFRNINKPQLVNSINSKNMSVEVNFSIGSKEYKIIRGAKPNRFEIYLNEEMINQDASLRDYQRYLEEHVLKLNYKSFTQIVILGSASFTPFMQLPTGQRRDIIEDLLDIRIFSTMNEVLKDKYSALKDKVTNLDSQISVAKSKAELQSEYIATLEEDKDKKIKSIESQIEETNTEIATYSAEVEDLETHAENHKKTIEDEQEIVRKRQKLGEINTKLQQKIKDAQKEISFYTDNDVCPTCSQSLTEDVKHEHIHTHETKIQEIQTAIGDLQSQAREVETRIEEIERVRAAITELDSGIIRLNSQIIAGQNYAKRLQKDLEDASTNVGNIDDEKGKLKELAKEVVKLSGERSELGKEKHYYDMASVLLKDSGIKTKIIRQYLPIINKLINKYLQAMDFFVHFELDESFKETIKSRHRDDFSYESFSEGEKQRIDLALLFAWRTIAKMKNSTNTNLLILDEVFDSSLDVNGTEFVMTLLNTLGQESNVFVISHKDVLFDKFRSVVRFEKKQNFSVLV